MLCVGLQSDKEGTAQVSLVNLGLADEAKACRSTVIPYRRPRFFVLGRVVHMGTFWQLMLYGIIAAVFASYLQRRKKKAAEKQASE